MAKAKTTPAIDTSNLLLPAHYAKKMGVSKKSAYKAINSGRVTTVRIGVDNQYVFVDWEANKNVSFRKSEADV